MNGLSQPPLFLFLYKIEVPAMPLRPSIAAVCILDASAETPFRLPALMLWCNCTKGFHYFFILHQETHYLLVRLEPIYW